jgi:hypothetical protein
MIWRMRALLRISAAAALAALVGAAIWAAPGGAVGYAPALQTIKPGQVGQIQLGDTIASLSKRKLIGGLKPGCELDPGQRVAKLKSPLKGFAIFFHGGKRLSSLVVEGGAETAKHIRVGSTVREAKQAYPAAEYDRPGNVEPFAEGFLWVNDSSNPKMTFLIEPNSKRVEAIDLPSPNFCE